MADINVSITKQGQVLSQAGFGICLLVATDKAFPYKLYDISKDLSAVQTDFPSGTILNMAETFAAQQPRPQKLAIFGADLSASSSKATDLATALNTLISTNNDWLRLALDDQTEVLITAVSTWTEANEKIFYTQFGNTTFTTNFSTNTRTVLGFKLVPETGTVDRLDCAMMGFASSRTPGSFTFKFKQLNEISADALSGSQVAAAEALNMNCYYNKFSVIGVGTAQIDGGTTASGDFIDSIESRDYVKATISQSIAQLLISTDKVPFDDDGIQQVVACVQSALNQAYNDGIISTMANGTPNFNVNYKSINALSNDDVAARNLKGITFSYSELGAIHSMDINGSVTVDL
jgi:hypothetical protein